jgi:hypothetical protein
MYLNIILYRAYLEKKTYEEIYYHYHCGGCRIGGMGHQRIQRTRVNGGEGEWRMEQC